MKKINHQLKTCSGKAISLISRALLCGYIFSRILLCGYIFALEIKSVTVTDQLGSIRTNYSSTEKINFEVKVYNGAAIDRINFRFEIYDPNGAKRFTHTGNSIPGTVGEGGSSVKYIPISNFFSAAGNYKLVVFANTSMSETSFSVYPPNIILTYPLNYARDLTDKPLIFRWVASGAAKYKLYVDDDAAFFNCIFTDETVLTEYNYPEPPTDSRQKLSAGTVYYWKIEGLDAAGNIVAKTTFPFNFTIKSAATTVTAKDLTVIDITSVPSEPKVSVSVKNQGGKTENSVPLSLYLNGMLVGTQNIDIIAVGETKNLSFLTNISGLVIAMASLTFDDDYIKNNTLTRQISVYAVVVSTSPAEIEKAKILGTVMTLDGKKLADAVVNFDGQSKGSVLTNKGGEYKIENLSVGEYKLTASASGYIETEKVVQVDKLKAFTNVDFKLNAVEVTKKEDYSKDIKKLWTKLKEFIKDEKIISQLDGYEISDVETKADINQIISELEEDKAKITEIEILPE